jgi:PGF-CTERM protein
MGGDDYVDCGNDATLNFGTGSFSVSVWVKSNEATNTHDIITKSQRSGVVTPKRWRIGQNRNSDVFFDIDDDTKSAATPHSTAVNIADGSWHHIVAVRKAGTSTELFIDGMKRDSDADRGDINNTERVYLGCKSDKDFFNGLIDEVKIYNHALSANEIQELYLSSQTPTPTLTPSKLDSDGDGWSDEKEEAMGTNPYSIDSDKDGLNDPQDPNPTVPEEEKGLPGFEAMFAIAGLLAVAHLALRRR